MNETLAGVTQPSFIITRAHTHTYTHTDYVLITCMYLCGVVVKASLEDSQVTLEVLDFSLTLRVSFLTP